MTRHSPTVEVNHRSGASWGACSCGWRSGAFAMASLSQRAADEHSATALVRQADHAESSEQSDEGKEP